MAVRRMRELRQWHGGMHLACLASGLPGTTAWSFIDHLCGDRHLHRFVGAESSCESIRKAA